MVQYINVGDVSLSMDNVAVTAFSAVPKLLLLPPGLFSQTSKRGHYKTDAHKT